MKTHIYQDGTFGTPKPFKQMFTIHCDHNGYFFPCVYCLLDSKTEVAYTALFRYLKEKLFKNNFYWQDVMSDFELASINAIKSVFGQHINIHGCYFHFCQAIMRKVSDLGMKPLYHNPSNVIQIQIKKFIIQFMALAYAPPKLVEACYTIIKSEINALHMTAYENQQVSLLITYFERNWILEHKISGWNVYGLNHTTNNNVEGWHSHMKQNRIFNIRNLWIYVKALAEENTSQHNKYLNVLQSNHTHKLEAVSVKREKFLANCYQNFNNTVNKNAYGAMLTIIGPIVDAKYFSHLTVPEQDTVHVNEGVIPVNAIDNSNVVTNLT